MEYASGLIKLKPCTEGQVAHFLSVIASRLEEAVATLQDEAVEIASRFKIEIENQKYLLWYLRAKSIKRVF